MNRRDMFKLACASPIAVPMAVKAALQSQVASGVLLLSPALAEKTAMQTLTVDIDTTLALQKISSLKAMTSDPALRQLLRSPRPLSVEVQMREHDLFDMEAAA